MPRRLLILGSTGSIGTQALDVVARSRRARARRPVRRALLGAARRAGARARRAADRAGRRRRRRARRRGVDRTARCSPAPRGSCGSSSSPSADLVLNALVGSAGLGPTVATLGEGIDLALANKESLVVGGELVTQLAEATGAQIIPVDSEHSALHQLLAGQRAGDGRAARAHRLGRPVPRPHRARSSPT